MLKKLMAGQRRVAHRRTGSVCLLFKHPALAGKTELKKREREKRDRKKMNACPKTLSHPSLVMKNLQE